MFETNISTDYKNTLPDQKQINIINIALTDTFINNSFRDYNSI